MDSNKLASLRLKYQKNKDIIELIDAFAKLKQYNLSKENVSNGYVFFIYFDEDLEEYCVVISNKKYYEETGYINDQHISGEIEHLLPDIIGGEVQEAVFETFNSDPEVIRKEMLAAGFEEIPNLWS